MSIAVQTMTASLAYSDGWMEPPKRKRREPWIAGAMLRVNGSTQSDMSTMAPIIRGQAISRHHSASRLAATMNSTVPAAMPVSWRTRKCVLAKPDCMATIALAL